MTALPAAAVVAPRRVLNALAPHQSSVPLRAFDLHHVRLRPGAALDAQEVNRRYLMGLDPDRLLHMFRLTAGLPSRAEPLGGWEAPDNELRGHFTGHYLSACAALGAHSGDERVRQRGVQVAAGLAECQAALSGGYLSAFPQELFERLREGKPAWAPFYTLHKIMAGLLDTHTLSGDAGALETLRGMARWTESWVQPLDEAQMARVIEREYGGMNEVLYNLAGVTHDARWSRLAHRFDRERVFGPLAAGHDDLTGLHANTTIPQITGAARGYELTGSAHLHDTAQFFWRTVTGSRCYCTGGSSNGESWNAPAGQLAHELSGYTEESCVTYNLRKLTRHVFTWSADARMGDYLERTYYNGILGVQHPADGDKLYYLPLQSGYWKLFGTPLHDFWCCTGSMAEAFATLGDSIYFHDGSSLYVNLFVASEVNWTERGVRVVQETSFPEEQRVRLTVRIAHPARFALRIRVPYWSRGANASLNGEELGALGSSGRYFSVERRWHDADEVQLQLPMHLHAAPMPDDATLLAVMYGPLVLAARLGTAGLDANTLRAEPTRPRKVPQYRAEPIDAPIIRVPDADPVRWLEPVAGRSLTFHTVGQSEALVLEPLNRIFDERYAVYWRIAQS